MSGELARDNMLRMEKIVSLCKRRGFIFQASEIYGGLNGAWDYGPLGTELKRNLKDYWWRVMVRERDDVVGLDGSILTHPAVLKASGHVDTFTDPMVDSLVGGKRYRADQIPSMSGWVVQYCGALDGSSVTRLLKEKEQPERSVAWSQMGLDPYLRDFFSLVGTHIDENGTGYLQFADQWNDDRFKALEKLVNAGLFEQSSTQRFAAIEIGNRTNTFRFSSDRGFNPAIKIAIEFYKSRGVRRPVVLLFDISQVTNTTRYDPDAGAALTEPRNFNLMFKTGLGPVDHRRRAGPIYSTHSPGATGPSSDQLQPNAQPTSGSDTQVTTSLPLNVTGEDDQAVAYLRPETAQSIFVQFKNVLDVSRKKLPFGIAQIGKAFRNEINPRNFTFRSREFEQMELEYFCRPEQGIDLLEYWKEERLKFYENIGIKREKLHVLTVPEAERAFYSKGTYDIEYEFPFGWQELEGVANRTDYDLTQHIKASGKALDYFDEETKERFVPHVVEPSAGVDRTVLALICEAYDEDSAPDEKGKMETRIVLRFHPRMAPIKCAVFPLLKNKEALVAKAREVQVLLRPHMNVFYDESGAIGRRYRRQDEIGTPFCVTIDFETLGEKGEELRDTVTLRGRDSMKQERIAIGQLVSRLLQQIT